jgi:indolepyruvate ferredoxin oxidoreductase, beta subunit
MVIAAREVDIIIAGVGGQGVVLMSELLGNAAVREGLKVMGSEVLGMSQRGGSVFSNIRLGSEIYAPMTADGQCDILLALEPSEALRNIQYLNESSIVVMNTNKVIPSMVSIGKSTYPELSSIKKMIKNTGCQLQELDALDLARKAGHIQAINVVMLGALIGTGNIPIRIETMKTIMAEKFSSKLLPINIKAFEFGYQLFSGELS